MMKRIKEKMNTPITWGTSFKWAGITIVVYAIWSAIALVWYHFKRTKSLDETLDGFKSEMEDEA